MTNSRDESVATGQPAAAFETAIGIAWLDQDLTLVLKLSSGGFREPDADGLIRIRKNDPDYQKIRQHIGVFRDGEKKAVPPLRKNDRP